MDYLLLQMLNGVQLGLLMFLLAAGLTLTFGIMDLVNLAHGSLYMMGAYIAWTTISWADSFVLGALLALPAIFVLGLIVEAVVARRLYARNHLDQVLATFGLILFFNELVRVIWGPAGKSIAVPAFLNRTVEILPGVPYPAYRFAIIVVGAAVAILLAWLVARTRLGMLIRAGASNREMVQSLGLDIQFLYRVVFAAGVAIAVLAGMLSLQQGFVQLFQERGRADLAVFLRKGATSEGESGLTREQCDIVQKEVPEVQKNAQGQPPNPKTDIQTPVFAGFIAPDITFFGFDIDRDDVADWCFVLARTDPGAKKQLEAILHPLIGTQAQALAAAADAGQPVVFDVPLLTESAHWRQRVDRVLVVDCDESVQVTRVMQRSGWAETEVQRVLAQRIRALPWAPGSGGASSSATEAGTWLALAMPKSTIFTKSG